MRIRHYRETDWAAICEIHDLARADELKHANLADAFVPLVSAAQTEGLFDYDVMIAEQKDNVVAFIAYDEEEIAWLYVHPQQFRKGFGKALVERVVSESTTPFQIEILKGNENALSLYTSCGFKHIAMESGAMPGNESFHVTVHVLSNA